MVNARLTCCSASQADRCGEPVTSTQGSLLDSAAEEDASLINWARKRANGLANGHRMPPSPGPSHRVGSVFLGAYPDIAGKNSTAASRPATTLNPATIRAEGDADRTPGRSRRSFPNRPVSPPIILERVLTRVGHHGLGAARLSSRRSVPGGEPVARPGDADKRGPRSKDHWIDRDAPAGCFFRAAIILQGLVETDDEPRQGRGVAKRVQGREPGHASFAVAGFLAMLGPEVENGHAQVRVALDRNQDGIARFLRESRCQARRNCRGITPPSAVAVADSEPELVEAEVLVLTAAVEALAVLAVAVRTTNWDPASGRGLERVERRQRRATRATALPSPTVAPAREKTEMVSEPWLLTRTSKSPLALSTTSIALGSAGVTPCGQQVRRHAQAVALRDQEIDDRRWQGPPRLARSTGPARPAPAGRRRPRWRRRSGSFRSNRTRFPAAVTA